MARKVAGSGMLPYIGIQHHNRQNSLPFVDDLMEPFRSLVDCYVYDFFKDNEWDLNDRTVFLDPVGKRHMASFLVASVETTIGTTNFLEGLSHYVNSIYQSFKNKKVDISYPDIIPHN